jgi:hypothetical protein
MARVKKKPGDVFVVGLDDNTCKYFQYIANDVTQLGSDIIRAFEESYPCDAEPDLRDVVAGEVGFYAHCVLKWGIEQNLWEKAGHIPEVGRFDITFRSTVDSLARPGKVPSVSCNWRVWRIGEPLQEVGRLKGAHRNAEIGLVFSPRYIVNRLPTGEYDLEDYPGFE